MSGDYTAERPMPPKAKQPSTADVVPRFKRRSVLLVLAVCIVLTVASWWWRATYPPRRPYATVQQSLLRAAEPGPREYRLTAVHHRYIFGPSEETATLYVDGPHRFVLKHKGLIAPGETLIGGNERENWVVLPRGRVLLDDERVMQQELAANPDWATVFFHITDILEWLSSDYKLDMLADDVIQDYADGSREVTCRHVRGEWRRMPKTQLPHVIELWADANTGDTRRLVLEWQLRPNENGCSKLTIDLVGCPELPSNWFEYSAHSSQDPETFR